MYLLRCYSTIISATSVGGYYNTSQAVTLKMNESGLIYYTVNGNTPNISSTLYTGPINIKTTKTLKYIAIDDAGNTSPTYNATYTIDKVAPKIASANPTNKHTRISKVPTIAN